MSVFFRFASTALLLIIVSLAFMTKETAAIRSFLKRSGISNNEENAAAAAAAGGGSVELPAAASQPQHKRFDLAEPSTFYYNFNANPYAHSYPSVMEKRNPDMMLMGAEGGFYEPSSAYASYPARKRMASGLDLGFYGYYPPLMAGGSQRAFL